MINNLKVHELQPQVLCYPVYGIYADYDANIPNTVSSFFLSTKELADEVIGIMNRNQDKYVMCYAEGWEHRKTYSWRNEYVNDPKSILRTLQEVFDFFEDNGYTEDESSDE